MDIKELLKQWAEVYDLLDLTAWQETQPMAYTEPFDIEVGDDA